MGDKLNYIVEDNIIAEVLGRNNFSTKESAILELIKNAYDAGASKLNLIFKKSENTGRLMLEIIDDGSGMNENDIRQAWMHVGKSTRDYKDSDTGRIFAGSKGIGRFALARLGESIDMFTKKESEIGYHWQTNWNSSEIDIDYNIASQGTRIQINELRDKWSTKSIKPLKNYISKTYRDSKMKISIMFLVENGESLEEETELIWTNPKIGENYLESIAINYNSKNKILSGQVLSDEFNDSVLKMTSKNIKEYLFEQNMIDELNKEISELIIEEEDIEKQDITEQMIADLLEEVGSFEGQLYFSLNSVSQVDKEKYEYKYTSLSNRFNIGVILYRNAFSIDSFEGRTDWLELGKRSTSSPAAASHPTGSWRIRRNQLSGYILIDKEENSHIEDISNRQGIVQNIHFIILKKIIDSALKEFESYRQSIIRDIRKIKDKENRTSAIKEVNIENKIDSFIEQSKSIEELTIQDLVEVKNKLSEYKNKVNDITSEKNEVKVDFTGYDESGNLIYNSEEIASLVEEAVYKKVGLDKDQAKALTKDDPVAYSMLAQDRKLSFKLMKAESMLKTIHYEFNKTNNLKNGEEMEHFCVGMQAYSPVDAHVHPIPGDMPGYEDKIIMAGGTFVQGSSIELSADGPIRPPYTIFMQGGLVFEHSMLGILGAAEELLKHR